jgi:hypothetical protein
LACVDLWQPHPDSSTGDDIAGLTLAIDPAPDGARPASVSPDSPQGRPVWVFGYPQAPPRTNGAWVEAKVQGPVSDGLIQLDRAVGSAVAIQQGYSGSPVIDCQDGRVLGMVVKAGSQEHPAADGLALSAPRLLSALSADLDGPVTATAGGRNRCLPRVLRRRPGPDTRHRLASLVTVMWVIVGCTSIALGLPDPVRGPEMQRQSVVSLQPSGPGRRESALRAAELPFVVEPSTGPLRYDLSQDLTVRVNGAPGRAIIRLSVLGVALGRSETASSGRPDELSLAGLRVLVGGPVIAELTVDGRPGTATFTIVPVGNRLLTVPGFLAVVAAMFILGTLEGQLRRMRRRRRVDLAGRFAMTLLGTGAGLIAGILAWLVRSEPALSYRLVFATAICGAGAAISASTALAARWEPTG